MGGKLADRSEDSLGTLFVGFRSCNSYYCDMSLVIDCEAGIDNNASALVRGGVKLVWDF
jgi:hypothetical protein